MSFSRSLRFTNAPQAFRRIKFQQQPEVISSLEVISSFTELQRLDTHGAQKLCHLLGEGHFVFLSAGMRWLDTQVDKL